MLISPCCLWKRKSQIQAFSVWGCPIGRMLSHVQSRFSKVLHSICAALWYFPCMIYTKLFVSSAYCSIMDICFPTSWCEKVILQSLLKNICHVLLLLYLYLETKENQEFLLYFRFLSHSSCRGNLQVHLCNLSVLLCTTGILLHL